METLPSKSAKKRLDLHKKIEQQRRCAEFKSPFLHEELFVLDTGEMMEKREYEKYVKSRVGGDLKYTLFDKKKYRDMDNT